MTTQFPMLLFCDHIYIYVEGQHSHNIIDHRFIKYGSQFILIILTWHCTRHGKKFQIKVHLFYFHFQKYELHFHFLNITCTCRIVSTTCHQMKQSCSVATLLPTWLMLSPIIVVYQFHSDIVYLIFTTNVYIDVRTYLNPFHVR